MANTSTVQVKLGPNATSRSNICINNHGIIQEGELVRVSSKSVQPGGLYDHHIKCGLLSVVEGEATVVAEATIVVEAPVVVEAPTVVQDETLDPVPPAEDPVVPTEPKKTRKKAE